MPKGAAKGKSSASSATRKKQAAKAAAKKAADDALPPPPSTSQAGPAKPQRGQKKDKKSKKEPKKKVFVPPPKPPQPPPDPLDALGLAKSLDGELVVLLRKAGKKDVITRTRALEALLEWIGHDTEAKEADLVMMLPCWAHLFPRLSTSPTRRLRLLTAQIHAALLSPSSSTRSELLLTPTYIEEMLGPFSILSFDTDRSVSRISRSLWDSALSFSQADAESKIYLGGENLGILLAHLSLLLLTQSASASLSSHTPALAAPSAPGGSSGFATPNGEASAQGGILRDAKSRDDSNVEEDTGAMDGRLVASALGALDWCVGHQPDPKPVEAYEEILTSSQLWSALTSIAPVDGVAAGEEDDEEEDAPTAERILGLDSPPARTRGWALLRTTLLSWPDMADRVVSIKGPELLNDAWSERDRNVQRSMLDALLPLLKARPDIWEMRTSGGEQEEEDEEGEVEEQGNAGTRKEEEKDYEEVSAASDSDEEEEEEGEAPPRSVKAAVEVQPSSSTKASKRSQALSGFTAWLEQACGGYPEVAYPAVLVLLSTMPTSLLPIRSADEYTRFLDRLNAPLDARILDSSPLALRGFVACSAECTAWSGNRLAATLKGQEGEKERLAGPVHSALKDQVGRMWDELILGPAGRGLEEEERRLRRLRIRSAGHEVVVQEVGKSIRKLAAGPAASGIVEEVVERGRSALQYLAGIAQDDEDVASARIRLVSLLATLKDGGAGASQKLVESVIDLVLDVSGTVANLLCQAQEAENVVALLGLETVILDRFGQQHKGAGGGVGAFGVLCEAAESSIPLLLERGMESKVPSRQVAAFYRALLGLVEDGEKRAKIWSKALNSSWASPAALLDLFDLVADSLPRGALDDADGRNRSALSKHAEDWLTEKGSSGEAWDEASEKVLHRLVERPEPLIGVEDARKLRAQLASIVIQRSNAESASKPLRLLDQWRKGSNEDEASQRCIELGNVDGLPSALFELAFFEGSTVARDMWNDVSPPHADRKAALDVGTKAAKSVQARCWDLTTPLTSLAPSAEDLRAREVPLAELLPDAGRLEGAYQELSDLSPSPALAIVDPLIPLDLDLDSNSGRPRTTYDAQGLSAYARSVLYLVEVLESDRQGARKCLWTLPHIVLVAMLVEDRLSLDTSSTELLGPNVARQTLESTMQRLVRMATSLLSNATAILPDSFHQEAAEALQKGAAASGNEEPAISVLGFAWRKGPNSARVFARILNGVLSFSAAGSDAASGWLRLGQVMQDRQPQLAMAVLSTVKGLLEEEESPVYDRLRGELCSRLSGVPPSKAVEQGLPLLALVLSAAPSADSPTALLPQQRALFLVQAMQKWMASDEDLPPTIDTRLAQLLVLILPIVQDQPGSHLDFAFDLVETILEPASFEDREGLPSTFAGLRLLQTLRDLALRNKTLREVWKERKDEAMGMLHRLFLSLADASGDSAREAQTVAKSRDVAKDLCLDILVDLLRDLPPSTFQAKADQNALIELVHGASSVIQVVSYRTLSATLRDQVKRHVVELATRRSTQPDVEGSQEKTVKGEEDEELKKDVVDLATRSEIPSELLAAVSTPLDVESLADDETAEASDRSKAFAFFLCWLAVLDHFDEASFNVRSVYSAQLNRCALVATSLLPTVFAMTSSSAAIGPLSRVAFDPSPFVVDEVFLDDIEPQSITSLRMLATHVYYRSLLCVPTLIREWWFSIKDRQLSTHVSDFTLHHCSPLVASCELAQLRQPEALAELEDENLSVRVLGSSEVVATYTIDEHPMEIGVRIPKDYPLRPLEVQAKERVGVSEQQLRSWILLMTIQTEQTGSIFDAIAFFKRSAASRFEEYQDGAECAICYCIVSPTDRSLPNKPCKTCKKQFHASCLFKWVSTSGSSTCPLCRSIL